MIKRLNLYFKEMYPIVPRALLAILYFAVVYFVILLNNGYTTFNIGYQEGICAYTIFAFYLLLRIADDFKDYETDQNLYPQKLRPLPSGKVKKSDLKICLGIVTVIAFILNIVFMNNLPYFTILYLYGGLMAVWFFQRRKIQNDLVLALITHNPVQILLTIYIISFTVIKYGVSPFSLITILTAFTLYLPALIWEVGRKVRAPKNEDNYTTYSKLFGYKKVVVAVNILIIINAIINGILLFNLNKFSLIPLIMNVIALIAMSVNFAKEPEKISFKKVVEAYIYIQEIIMALIMVLYVFIGKV